MARILETEVMNDPASVEAYTQMTMNDQGLARYLLDTIAVNQASVKIADLGCGNCGYYSGYDPAFNTMYQTFPNAIFDGIEASAPMIAEAEKTIESATTQLIQTKLPDASLINNNYDIVFSSLFLHQLPDAMVCWNTIKQIGKLNSTFYVFDLLRVEDSATCTAIVEGMTPDAPDVFKTDFYNTLRASFTVNEIKQQLFDAGLTATVTTEEIYPNCSVVYVTGTIS